MPAERGGRIAIERRPDFGRNRGQRHLLGVEDAGAVGKMVHLNQRRSRSGARTNGRAGWGGLWTVCTDWPVCCVVTATDGGSSGPLRPQPASASPARLTAAPQRTIRGSLSATALTFAMNQPPCPEDVP